MGTQAPSEHEGGLRTAVDPDPPPDAAVRAELARMLDGSPFQNSPRMCDLLAFVVDEALADRSYRINERTIALDALGRPASFDQRVDPVVRVLARRVRAGIDRYYAIDGRDDPVRIDIPKGAYVPRFRWTAATGDGPAVASGPPLVAVVEFARRGVPTTRLSSVVDEIVARLGGMAGLRVVGPVADSTGLDADYVLHGTVTAKAAALRVAARLVETAGGETIWAHVFDHVAPGDGGFDFEAQVAIEVSAVLGDYLGVVHRHVAATRGLGPGADPYDAMLRYFDSLTELDTDKRAPTMAALERALEDDPGNADLTAMLAGSYLSEESRVPGEIPEVVERAQVLIRRAALSEPENPHVVLVLMVVEMMHGRLDTCRDELDRLVLLAEDRPTLLYLAGAGYTLVGEWDRGVEVMRRAMQLNPNHPGYQYLYVAIEDYRRGDYEAALRGGQRIDVRGWLWGPVIRAVAFHRLGRTDEARLEMAAARHDVPDLDATTVRGQLEGMQLGPDLIERILADLDAIGW